MYGRTLHDDKSDGHLGQVTVQYALERSSDVGAAKMELKVGNQKFYDYMRAFGFGDRSGIELPSETRGLLRNPKKWGATSILSMAIGQEIGVTPVQLVTMVSTIANGGVYMPPHVLLQSTDEMKGDARLKPAGFRPSNQLPATLPDGAHRGISEMTSAKRRMLMQGIVGEGGGKEDVVDDAPADSTADLNAMFDDVNSLPADDPLRMSGNAAAAVVSGGDTSVVGTAPKVADKTKGVLDLLPAKVVDAFHASGETGS